MSDAFLRSAKVGRSTSRGMRVSKRLSSSGNPHLEIRSILRDDGVEQGLTAHRLRDLTDPAHTVNERGRQSEIRRTTLPSSGLAQPLSLG